MKFYSIRFALILFFPFIFLVHPNDLNSSTPPTASIPSKGAISRISSVTTHESESGTTVTILGNGKIFDYKAITIDFPPRIVVDIFCNKVFLNETETIVVDSPNLKIIRVGIHAQKIRVVLDIKGADLPKFITNSSDNKLTVILKSVRENKTKKGTPKTVQGENMEKGAPELKEEIIEKNVAGNTKTAVQIRNIEKEEPELNEQIIEKDAAGNTETLDEEVEIPEKNTNNFLQDKERLKIGSIKKPGSGKELTQIVIDDGKDDTIFFLQALDKYMAQDWSGAIESFTNIIKKYPSGRYSEKAYFLLAKSYYKLHSNSISSHFNEIKNHYQDAINRFTSSEYLPDALLDMGNIYYQAEKYFEALSYYNLVVKKTNDSILAVRALMKKAIILLIKKKKREAIFEIVNAENVVYKFADVPEKTEIKKIKAKIFYEMNRFRKSLDILAQLKKENTKNIYLFPEISLYLGYNYYQLGENKIARQNLLRFYNIRPNHKMSHLILTQIGDTYRNDRLINDAVKIYQIVIKRYSNTEGAVISKIRLAEIQEEGNIEEKVSEKIGSPKDIYVDIAENALPNGNNNTLRQLSLLKLAIFYQKEKEYQKSFDVLKDLLKKYPRTSLKKEAEHTLQGSIKEILKEEMKKGKYVKIINFYFNEKEIFSIVNDTELLLIVARAFKNFNLEDMAIEVFKKAEVLLSDQKKPSDLLFLVGRDFFEQDKFKRALTRFNLLIENYPYDKYTPYAYRLKGIILIKQKNYVESVDMFSAAMSYPIDRCYRGTILVDKAKALAMSNFSEKALSAIKNVGILQRDCPSFTYQIYQEIGDTYLKLGKYEKAIDIFYQAVEMTKEQAEIVTIKLKIAQCYWLLNKKGESLALYEQISNLNDPFWSNVVNEKMEEINFKNKMRKID